jgi:hypothetical protein
MSILLGVLGAIVGIWVTLMVVVFIIMCFESERKS